jgi:hypothetical protein
MDESALDDGGFRLLGEGEPPGPVGAQANPFDSGSDTKPDHRLLCARELPPDRTHKVNVLTATEPSPSCPGAESDFRRLTSDRTATPKTP